MEKDSKVDIIFQVIETGVNNGIPFELISKVAGEAFGYTVFADTFEATLSKGNFKLIIENRQL